jgi:hypothetical protein
MIATTEQTNVLVDGSPGTKGSCCSVVALEYK